MSSFGALWAFISGLVYLNRKVKNTYSDIESIAYSKMTNRDYYYDSKGVCRLLSNNHIIQLKRYYRFPYEDNVVHIVDYDITDKKILYDYTAEEEIEKQKKKSNELNAIKEFNLQSKKDASDKLKISYDIKCIYKPDLKNSLGDDICYKLKRMLIKNNIIFNYQPVPIKRLSHFYETEMYLIYNGEKKLISKIIYNYIYLSDKYNYVLKCPESNLFYVQNEYKEMILSRLNYEEYCICLEYNLRMDLTLKNLNEWDEEWQNNMKEYIIRESINKEDFYNLYGPDVIKK